MEFKNDFVDLLFTTHTRDLSFHSTDPQTVIEDLTAAKNVWAIFRGQLGSIEKDVRLNETGRKDEKRKARDKALSALRKWHQKVDGGLAKHEEQLVGQIRTAIAAPKPTNPSDALARAIEAQEIRAAVRGMDPLLRAEFYKKAPAVVREALDAIPIVKVENGIGNIEPFVTAETQEEALLSEAAARFPEKSGLLEDIRALRMKYEIFKNVIEQESYKLAGRPETDPVICDGDPVAQTS